MSEAAKLFVFKGSDGVDHIVAESAEDAHRVQREYYGEPYAGDDPITWELVPDETPIIISYEDESEMPDGCSPDVTVIVGESRPKVTLTAREWADRTERGILCSTEW